MKKLFKLWPAIFITAMLTACTSDFEDINTDPDALSEAPPTNVLLYVIRYTADQLGNDMDGFGTYAGYISKIQYMDNLGGVAPTNNTFGNRWINCYRGNEQLRVVLEKTEATAEGNKNIRWACRIFQIYLWLCNIDMYGDMPYSEAMKGSSALGGILTPKYDKEQDIYPDLLAKLKTIADEMAAGYGTDDIGEGDVLFHSDVNKWQRFCNSLRLRAAIRLSAVAPSLAKTTVEEIAGNPTKYPIIDSQDSKAYFKWVNSSPYFERWYENSRSRDDHGFFDTFIEHLKKMEDPRLAIIAKPAKTDGEYRGYENGASSTPDDLGMYSRIGAIYRDDPAGTTPFFKACESFYLLAEAAVLGWNVNISAEEAYEKAVRLSMEDNGVDEADVEAYLAGKGKWDNTKERIWWDQWVALFKENLEAWSLFRRTGIPTADVNYVSRRSMFGSAHNSQPFRVQYPEHERLNNEANYKAANQGIVDYCWGRQLWWDKRTGVK
ncbi:MAG: SusD/RagB family nutrient-binding outer membrane lipoprotein [Tannerellaceae bacterium]|jgi:hypothetical protein|nr:SusD/RagB family nutrient-binding outer membrane lipoprotein [Tannerellaceae bacterium]